MEEKKKEIPYLGCIDFYTGDARLPEGFPKVKVLAKIEGSKALKPKPFFLVSYLICYHNMTAFGPVSNSHTYILSFVGHIKKYRLKGS